ncbi:MAG: 1,2-epoxyphenylacetyl-CoA isomerase [Alphaproteobacteria bacterium MarineAlpha2_Bin1]|nr:MAG: 1,2-epoxyphenylacetyl-CoA isomerase [Alphaproteobacteria bacterium MarineAlpha2_Bin1]
MTEEVLLKLNKNIATIKFNRPEVLNAMNEAFGKCLIDISQEILSYSSLKCIVFEGEGDHFCAGGDINMFGKILELSPDERKAHFQKFLSQLHMSILNFINLPVPIIAKVRGAAAGFGLSLVLCSDLAIASTDAKFNLAYNHIGLSPDGGSTFFLPRLVGIKKAKEIAFLGHRLDAEKALELGIINRITKNEQLDSTVDALIEELSRGPTKAIGLTKKLINQSLYSSEVVQLEKETEFFSLSSATYDFEEGVKSFLEKRKPIFRGE